MLSTRFSISRSSVIFNSGKVGTPLGTSNIWRNIFFDFRNFSGGFHEESWIANYFGFFFGKFILDSNNFTRICNWFLDLKNFLERIEKYDSKYFFWISKIFWDFSLSASIPKQIKDKQACFISYEFLFQY